MAAVVHQAIFEGGAHGNDCDQVRINWQSRSDWHGQRST
jgi:hypothetical protein